MTSNREGIMEPRELTAVILRGSVLPDEEAREALLKIMWGKGEVDESTLEVTQETTGTVDLGGEEVALEDYDLVRIRGTATVVPNEEEQEVLR